MVLKSIEYPLLYVTIAAKHCNFIEPPDLCSSLQASALPSNTHRDVVAVPSSILGIKNGSLYGTQGCKHILYQMKLGKVNCIAGHHLREYIESHKLDIGLSGPLFSNNFPSIIKCTTK